MGGPTSNNATKAAATGVSPVPSTQAQPTQMTRSHTPPHQAYLKQQLQHKATYGSGMPPSPNSYPNNTLGVPPHHHPMGPPAMGPPNSHGPHQEGSGPMPPPSSTPNSHMSLDTPVTTTMSDMNDNSITTSATGE